MITAARPSMHFSSRSPKLTTRECELEFKRFPEGTVIDLVRPHHTSELAFAIWNGQKATIDSEYRHDGVVYHPPRVRRSAVARIVRLPHCVGDARTALELLSNVGAALEHYI